MMMMTLMMVIVKGEVETKKGDEMLNSQPL